MKLALTPGELRQAWEALSAARSAAEAAAKASWFGSGAAAQEALTELCGQFLWRYHIQLGQIFGSKHDERVAELEAAVAKIPGAGEVLAGLMISRDGSKTREMTTHLETAAQARPKSESAALRFAVALQAKDSRSSAPVHGLVPHVERATKHGEVVNPRLLATFAFLAASGGAMGESQDMQDLVFAALKKATAQSGTRGGAVAAVYEASITGKVPFELCQRIYDIERYLLFSPSHCHKRLELGTLLRRTTAVPQVVAVAQQMLKLWALECPPLAEKLSGMGQHWLDEADGTKAGLGGDLHARADIRAGIRDASYAILMDQLASGQVDSSKFYHSQALDSARTLQKRLADPARHCPLPEKAAPLVQPQIKMKCRDVLRDAFAKKCMHPALPCVVRGGSGDFLKDWEGGAQLLERRVGFAGNTSIRVAFPFDARQEGGLKSLNAIERTSDFNTRADVLESLEHFKQEPPDEARFPWTLVRPPNWNMRFSDLVTWARHHPQEVYMNQLMVADLGSEAVDDLQHPKWVEDSKLKILSPSLWLASGNVATGYHTDGPDNLLAQLAGSKDVLLLPPHEQVNLYYDEVNDVEANMSLGQDGTPKVYGLSQVNRSSSGHSVIDITDTAQSANFPRYKGARGMSCRIDAGDVLYIPAFWHHAVATTPSEECLGLSLNMWYHHDNKPKDMNSAMELSKRQEDKRRAQAKEQKAKG